MSIFKGFQDTSRGRQFHAFPNLNLQMNNEAYGFSGCTFWLDAAYGLNTQTDLAAVSKWIARTGGISFEQGAAGNQPRLISSDPNFNNKPSIQFNSNTRFLSSPLGGFAFSGTLVFVAKIDTLNGTCNTLLSNGGSQTEGAIVLGGLSANYTGIGAMIAGGTGYRIGGNVEDLASHIVVLTRERLVIDGVLDAAANWSPTNSFSSISLNASSTGQNLIGSVAEIIHLHPVLSEVDMIRMSDNLNSKYAIY